MRYLTLGGRQVRIGVGLRIGLCICQKAIETMWLMVGDEGFDRVLGLVGPVWKVLGCASRRWTSGKRG